jgi:hypothetical protein
MAPDKLTDMRLSLNDVYMSLLMTVWMFILVGIFYKQIHQLVFGIILATLSFVSIRLQLFITIDQYYLGMIPHHSMAIHMSKQLLKKNNIDDQAKIFVRNIIDAQNKEIDLMKLKLN